MPQPDLQAGDGLRLEDFVHLGSTDRLINRLTGEFWTRSGFNQRFPPVMVHGRPVPAASVVAELAPVDQVSWWPGKPQIIEDVLVAEAGVIDKPGARVFNSYRPGPQLAGDPALAGPWLAHGQRLFGDDWPHLLAYLAHAVQRPAEKSNHAIVLGGSTGIGKDSQLEPVREAVGAWNCQDIGPAQVEGRFNGFLQSVMLVLSEAYGAGGGAREDRAALAEHLKVICAAPPNFHRIDAKNRPEFYVPNVCRLVITTNHVDALVLSPDDRRYFVAWSDAQASDFEDGYFARLHDWYASGGTGHVAAYLRLHDISGFDAKRPPPRTRGFYRMLDAGRAPEDAELRDVLDRLKHPLAVTLADLAGAALDPEFKDWLTDRRNRRTIPHRMRAVGYSPVRNDAATDGLWILRGKRQVVYGPESLSERDRIAAAKYLVETGICPVSEVGEVSDSHTSHTSKLVRVGFH